MEFSLVATFLALYLSGGQACKAKTKTDPVSNEVIDEGEERVPTLSTQYESSTSYGPSECIDANADTFCHTSNENNAYFMMEYPSPVSVSEVKVQARKDCCGYRVQNVVVTVADTKPTKGTIVSGTQLGSKFVGPATNGEWISFKSGSGSGIVGRYVVVQQLYKEYLNLAEVEVVKQGYDGNAPSDDHAEKNLFVKEQISETTVKYKTDYTYRDFLQKLGQEEDVLNDFIKVLRESRFKAFFFETPKITAGTLSSLRFEFVLINAQRLENVQPNQNAFNEYFAKSQSSVTKFLNFRRDSQLIVPCPEPSTKLDTYSHLANFVRGAPQEQVVDFWKETSKAALERIKLRGSQPTWMSTSGLGVYWLHLRLDSRPKYYSYGPYKY